jgi:hypothetical protein
MNAVGASGSLAGGRLYKVKNAWSYASIPPYFIERSLASDRTLKGIYVCRAMGSANETDLQMKRAGVEISIF